MSEAKLSPALGSTALTEDERSQLETLFNTGACRVEVLDEHWIHGSDEGLSYCYDCAKKKVAELLEKEPDEEYSVDGGWGISGDSTPFCETCGAMLSNSLTDYACESEVEHFLEHGFDPASDHDCYAMSEVISASGWEPFDFAEPDYRRERRHEYHADLNKLGRRILDALKQSNNPDQP